MYVFVRDGLDHLCFQSGYILFCYMSFFIKALVNGLSQRHIILFPVKHDVCLCQRWVGSLIFSFCSDFILCTMMLHKSPGQWAISKTYFTVSSKALCMSLSEMGWITYVFNLVIFYFVTCHFS